MKKVVLKIESFEYGDEQLEQPVDKAIETTKEKLSLGNFAVTDKNEIIDEKTPDKEIEEKVEESSEIKFHKKRKEG